MDFDMRLKLDDTISALDSEPFAIDVSPCDRWLVVSGFEKSVALLDLGDLSKGAVRIGSFQEEGAGFLCFMEGARAVIGSSDGLGVFALPSGECLRLRELEGFGASVDFGAAIDGRRVVLQRALCRPERWDVENGECLAFEGPWPGSNEVAVVAGRYLATTTGGPLLDDPDGVERVPERFSLVSWDVETGKVAGLMEHPGKAPGVQPLVFHVEGDTVVVGWSTGKITRHDFATGKRLGTPGRRKHWVTHLWPVEGGGLAYIGEGSEALRVIEGPEGMADRIPLPGDFDDPDDEMLWPVRLCGGHGVARLLDGGRRIWADHLDGRSWELPLPVQAKTMTSHGDTLYLGLCDGRLAIVRLD